MIEDEGDYYDTSFNEGLEKFEKSLNGESLGFIDSDQIEFIIDHYLINGMYSKAVIAADLGINQFSFNHLFLLRKAQAISALGQLKEALDLLTQIEKEGNLSCEFFLTKASIFSQLKDSKRAIKYFKEALNLSDQEDKDEIYLDLALEYQSLSDFHSAIAILQEAIKFNSHNEGAIYELAFCYEQINEIKKAIKCYSDFINENPYSFTAWYNLGNAYSKLENFKKAIWAYDYCLLINEEFGPAYFNLGNAYLSSEKYRRAIENFEKCMEIEGEDGLALCYIGECYEHLNHYELAKHYYHRSIEFIPTLSEAWLGLGIVTDLEGNTIEAIHLIKKAIDLDPCNSSFYHVLAGAYEKTNNIEDAQAAYLMSLELDDSNEEALCDYINFLIELNLHKEAILFLNEYEINENLNIEKELLLINLKYLLNKIDEAVILLASCIQINKRKSLKLFSFYPKLKHEAKFVNLFSK